MLPPKAGVPDLRPAGSIPVQCLRLTELPAVEARSAAAAAAAPSPTSDCFLTYTELSNLRSCLSMVSIRPQKIVGNREATLGSVQQTGLQAIYRVVCMAKKATKSASKPSKAVQKKPATRVRAARSKAEKPKNVDPKMSSEDEEEQWVYEWIEYKEHCQERGEKYEGYQAFRSHRVFNKAMAMRARDMVGQGRDKQVDSKKR